MIPEERINANSSPDAGEETQKIAVDLNAAVEVDDATGDVNQASKLPPAGIAPIRWKAGKDDHPYAGVTKKEPHRNFVGTSLVGQFVEGEYEGTLIFENHINSLAMRGKPTSDLHHFLNVAGSPLSNKSTVGEVLEFTKEVLEAEPLVMTEYDWKASYKKDDGTYEDVLTKMEKFPKHYVDTTQGENQGKPLAKEKGGKWDGTYEQTIESPVNGEPINAQLYVKAFLSQAEAKRKMAASA